MVCASMHNLSFINNNGHSYLCISTNKIARLPSPGFSHKLQLFPKATAAIMEQGIMGTSPSQINCSTKPRRFAAEKLLQPVQTSAGLRKLLLLILLRRPLQKQCYLKYELVLAMFKVTPDCGVI